eukprot:s162_g29.t1
MLNFEGLLTQVFEAVEEEQAEEIVEEEADRGLPEVSIPEDLPLLNYGTVQQEWKPVRRKQAKQHKEVSNLQNQLAALEQLNRMGGHVGQCHRASSRRWGSVLTQYSESFLVPVLGLTTEQTHAEEYSVEISEQADAKERSNQVSGRCFFFQACTVLSRSLHLQSIGDEPLPDRQSHSEHLEHLALLAPSAPSAPGDCQDSMEREHNEMAIFGEERQEDVQDDPAQAAEAAEVFTVKEQEEQEEQEKELTQELS